MSPISPRGPIRPICRTAHEPYRIHETYRTHEKPVRLPPHFIIPHSKLPTPTSPLRNHSSFDSGDFSPNFLFTMNAAIDPVISSHIEALCAAIAADAEVQAARQQAESFLADEQGVALYRDVMTLGRTLEQRHRSGAELEPEEVNRFQSLQDQADAHEGIQNFVAAQDLLQDVANKVNGFVAKTLEKGRVPSHDEVFGSGGCGSGCGCH